MDKEFSEYSKGKDIKEYSNIGNETLDNL